MKASRLYAPMVGIPLIGVLIILHVGRRLEAAPAIHGAWRVRSAASTAGTAGCVGNLTADSIHTIVVSQSGPRATLQLQSVDAGVWANATVRIADHTATGTVDGPWPGNCAGHVVLTLRFAARPAADSAYGTIADTTCAACNQFAFVATRRRTLR